jgi:hypothetical protein
MTVDKQEIYKIVEDARWFFDSVLVGSQEHKIPPKAARLMDMFECRVLRGWVCTTI